MDVVDENTKVQMLSLITAIIGLIKVILEIVQLLLKWLEKQKTHPNRKPIKHKRKR